jgi:hypothetical protein
MIRSMTLMPVSSSSVVHDAAQRFLAYRHSDRLTRVRDGHAAFQAFRRSHGDRAHHTVAQLLLDFERDFGVVDHECVVYLGDLAGREFHVHDSANNLHSSSGAHYLGPLLA